MRNNVGMKFDCIFEEALDFIDINYTHLNKTVRYEKRPHGKWTRLDEYESVWRCSACDEVSCCKADFCSNCGADMRGDEE